MIKIVSFALLAILVGWGLATASIMAGLSTGWISALLLIGWAILARRYWTNAGRANGLEPGLPEQVIWLRTAGVGMLLGNLSFALANPQFDLHVGNGNTLAIDSWMLAFALLLATLLFRHDRRERDERHQQISAHGVRAGYAFALSCMALLTFFLAFAPQPMRAPLTHWLLANLLFAVMLASYLAQLIAQLIIYRARAA